MLGAPEKETRVIIIITTSIITVTIILSITIIIVPIIVITITIIMHSIVITIIMSSPGRLLWPLPTGSPGHEGLRGEIRRAVQSTCNVWDRLLICGDGYELLRM